jgi:hypothetical protein
LGVLTGIMVTARRRGLLPAAPPLLQWVRVVG